MSQDSTDLIVLRAFDFMGRTNAGEQAGAVSEEQAAAVLSSLAMVLFSTDEEWDRFMFSFDIAQRYTDSKNAVKRFADAYEFEASLREAARNLE